MKRSKTTQLAKITLTLLLAFSISGCTAGSNQDKVILEEPEGTITVIEQTEDEVGEPKISIIKIDRYEKIEVSESTVNRI